MTAIVAQRLADRIEIISDGALYDQASIVRGFECKIDRLSVNGIFTGRGLNRALNLISERVAKVADSASTYDVFLHGMRSGVETMREQAAALREDESKDISPFQVILAGISESDGPVIHTFGNTSEGGLGAFQLHNVPYGSAYGHSIPEEMHNHIVSSGGLRKIAVSMFDNIRNDPDGNAASMVVGGHIDFTTITADGVTIERIHEWNDEIGRRILPTNLHGMSRQQRRAIERERRKSAA